MGEKRRGSSANMSRRKIVTKGGRSWKYYQFVILGRPISNETMHRQRLSSASKLARLSSMYEKNYGRKYKISDL